MAQQRYQSDAYSGESEEESAQQDQGPASVENVPHEAEPPEEPRILMNFPSPVPLSSVLSEVARWSEYNIVMEPSLNRPIQIFAPNKMTTDQAFALLIASLQTIGLRVVEMDGSVIKIVPASLGKITA